MSTRIAIAILFGLGTGLLSGCAPWVNDVIHLAEDVKKTSDEYEQEKHEERVDELNREYEEFLRSKDEVNTKDEEPAESIVITDKDNKGN
jgi:hypothetical protein